MNPGEICPSCNGPLIEIDHYGEHLVGCIECNRWSWRLFMKLPDDDLKALRELAPATFKANEKEPAANRRLQTLI
jgi:hypothetical protein